MNDHSAWPRPPSDDVEIDDAPGLTADDRAALAAIRRQIDEEYGGVGEAVPSLATDAPAAVAARPTPRWSSQAVAALVAVAAFAGAVVGTVVTVRMLGDPGAGSDTALVGPLPSPDTVGPPPAASRVETEGPRDVMPPRPGAVSARAAARPAAPEPERAAPRPSAPGQKRPAMPAAARTAEPPVAAAPQPAREPAAAVPDPRAGATREEGAAPPGPETWVWVDSFRPLSGERDAHAHIARSAYRAARVPPVPAPDPPPSAPPLAAPAPPPGTTVAPSATPRGTPAPARTPRRGDELVERIREDWKSVKEGFASAPRDFKEAWQSLRRDLRSLFPER